MKIFGVGLNKTGTSTLRECLSYLGFTHYKCSYEFLKDYKRKNDFTGIFETAEKYDSFSDWPWLLIYKELDERFPGSKFILTVRKSEQTWLSSLKRHSLYTRPFHHCRRMAYGYNYPFWHEEDYIKIYKEHNREVTGYFTDRPDDFLILNWEQGDGWQKLCNFLDKDIPNASLPHRNPKKRIKANHRLAANALLILLGFFNRSKQLKN